jgi:hypothetical protein
LFRFVTTGYSVGVVVIWTCMAVKFYRMDRELYRKYPELWEENR